MSAEYQAMIYENKAEEPLLSKEQSSSTTTATPTSTIGVEVFSRFKLSSLLLGIMVGFFIQFSTLGANYLALSFMGEAILSVTQRDLIVFSLIWSLITSTMAIVVLAFLRNLIFTTYVGGDIEDIVLHMECRYVVGALIGVCTAWAATDVALGMTGQVVYSVITLIVALSWCRIMMWFFGSTNETPTNSRCESNEIMIV
jgi:hypothetical protein